MTDNKDEDKNRKKPTVAPGINDEDIGEDATVEDKRKGNVTKVARLVLNETDTLNV